MLREAPLGPPIYWLLPKQATFQAERELTISLGGFTRLRIISLDLLGEEILTHCGNVGIPFVSPVGRRLIISHLLRKHQSQLKFYNQSATRPGLAAELDSTFGEFERANLTADRLDNFIHQMEPQDDNATNLRDKLHDVNLLLTHYHAYIGQDRLDPGKRLEKVLKHVANCSLLKDAAIFVDDFYDFTGFEIRLLAAVAVAAKSMDVCILADPTSAVFNNPHNIPDELSPFHRTERTYRALYFAISELKVAVNPIILLKQSHRFKSELLTHLETSLFSNKAATQTNENSIRFFETPDARIEVDIAAREIQSALQSGLRLRDIVLLVRNLDDYHDLISASFHEHNLPFFADRRRSARHHPLLQFVRAAVLVALHRWPHEPMMTLLKSGLVQVEEEIADEIENYVLRHRIRGSGWTSDRPWQFKRELTRNEIDDINSATLTETSPIDDARKSLAAKLQPFTTALPINRPLPAKFIVTEIVKLLESFEVRQTLAKWIHDADSHGQFEQRGEHEQVWKELMELFQEIVDVLENEPIILADFLDVLDNTLENFDLALPPQVVDRILVGQIDRTRTPELKLAIVLGVNEGQFPQTARENSVLSDAERRSLQNEKFDLDPDTERLLLDEQLFAYIAFTRASSQLIVTRSHSDSAGRARNPSPFWDRLRNLFPDTAAIQVQRHLQNAPANIATPRQLVTSLMRWVRGGHLDSAPHRALYQWLAQHDCDGQPIDRMRYHGWKALGYSNTAQLEAEAAAKIFPSPLQATASQIETFAACPFRHFVRHGLKLRDRDDPDITAIDLSNAYHKVLEDLIGEILQSQTDWCELSDDEIGKIVQNYLTEVGRTLRGELMISSARNRYLLDRIERNLLQAIAAQREMNRRGSYRPAFASLRFGGENAKLPAHEIPTPGGKQIKLRGKIDRVDLNKKGSAFTIADYKLSAGALSLDDVFNGLSLQLLTNLLVLQACGEQLVGRKITPAAAFFLQLLRSPQNVDHPNEGMAIDHPDFHLRLKPRGLIESRAIHSLDNRTTKGASPVVSFFLKQDQQLGNRHNTDVAHESEFTAILNHVELKLGELADRIIAGEISITPYWINGNTPCPRCEYRSLCRFEPGINRYNKLYSMKREEVLAKLTIGGADVE